MLSRLRETQSLSQVRVTTLLRMGEYQLLQIEPRSRSRGLRSAVRWKIKDLLDFAVDDAVVDILEIPVDRGGRTAANVFVSLRRSRSFSGTSSCTSLPRRRLG